MSEFGADANPGMHAVPTEMFTEEYQFELTKAFLDVADTKDFVAGMHVWSFADFKTGQGIIRFGGMNYKGVFARDRKPKTAAHFLRSRWSEDHPDHVPARAQLENTPSQKGRFYTGGRRDQAGSGQYGS